MFTSPPGLKSRLRSQRIQAPGSRLQLWASLTGDPADVEPELQFRRIPPGTVIDATGDAIRVATGDGVLLILALQPEGKRAMTAREFLAGRPIAAGTRLS